MNSSLNIYKQYALPDFKKSGYGWNIVAANKIAPDGRLLPFFYPFAATGSSLSCGAFVLEGLDWNGEVAVSHVLSASLIKFRHNENHTVFYYNCESDILAGLTSYDNGIYRFRINLNDGAADITSGTYYSEPFEINDFKTVETIGRGDFSITDFNDDFYK